jgi:hypothetical protein
MYIIHPRLNQELVGTKNEQPGGYEEAYKSVKSTIPESPHEFP